jgi:hypothetical protein
MIESFILLSYLGGTRSPNRTLSLQACFVSAYSLYELALHAHNLLSKIVSVKYSQARPNIIKSNILLNTLHICKTYHGGKNLEDQEYLNEKCIQVGQGHLHWGKSLESKYC